MKKARASYHFKKSEFDDNLGMLPVPKSREIFYNYWKAQDALHWTNDLAVVPYLSKDKSHWDALSINCPRMYNLLTMIIMFFKCSDIFAGEISIFKILPHCNNVWVSAMLLMHANMESTHNEGYSHIANARFSNPQEAAKIEKNALEFRAIKRMIEWGQYYSNKNDNIDIPENCQEGHYEYFPVLLLRFICFEGIFFTGWFAVIYAVKVKGLMPALCILNEYIARDEWRHVMNTTAIFREVTPKFPEEKVHSIFKEAVGITKDFIGEAVDGDIPEFDLRVDDLCEYIEVVANIILVGLDYTELYPGAEMKLSCVKNKDLPTFASIHETRDPNYQEPISNGEDLDPNADI